MKTKTKFTLTQEDFMSLSFSLGKYWEHFSERFAQNNKKMEGNIALFVD